MLQAGEPALSLAALARLAISASSPSVSKPRTAVRSSPLVLVIESSPMFTLLGKSWSAMGIQPSLCGIVFGVILLKVSLAYAEALRIKDSEQYGYVILLNLSPV